MKVRVKHIDAIVDVSVSKAEKWIKAGYAESMESIEKIDKTEGAEPKKAVKKDKPTKVASKNKKK